MILPVIRRINYNWVVCFVLFNAITLAAFAQSKRVYLLDEGTGAARHTVYIENNRDVQEYNSISSFKFNEFDKSDYKYWIKQLKGKSRSPFTKINVDNLPLKWCSLRVYKGNYYVYYPSDWSDNYRIAFNDTTSIENDFEIRTSVILKISRLNNDTYTVVRKDPDKKVSTLIIHIIDEQKGIAVFENLFPGSKIKYMLMVRAEKVRQFPIIITHCEENRTPEWQFDEPDFKRLLADKGIITKQ